MRSLKLSFMCSLFAAVAMAAEGDAEPAQSPSIIPEMTPSPTASEVVYTPPPYENTGNNNATIGLVTEAPTATPTAAPTPAPTEAVYTPPPTAAPTAAPTEAVYTPPPTAVDPLPSPVNPASTPSPSTTPSSLPTTTPSSLPTGLPSQSPSSLPTPTTQAPSAAPSSLPTTTPSTLPTGLPSQSPSSLPTPMAEAGSAGTTGTMEAISAEQLQYTAPTGKKTILPYEHAPDGSGIWATILDQTNGIISVNPGKAIINELFWQHSTGVVRYLIQGQVYNYYQRLSLRDSFDLYSNLADTWSSLSNRLNADFRMYSTYEDLVAGSNPWQYCDYDDSGVGYPRNCAPVDGIWCLWTEFHGPELPHDNFFCIPTATSFQLQLLRMDAVADAAVVPPTPSPTLAPSLLSTTTHHVITPAPTSSPSPASSATPTPTPTALPTAVRTTHPLQPTEGEEESITLAPTATPADVVVPNNKDKNDRRLRRRSA